MKSLGDIISAQSERTFQKSGDIGPILQREARLRILLRYWFLSAILFLLSAATFSQTASPSPATGVNAISVTVTAIGRGDSAPPPLSQNDVVVHQGSKVRRVISWESTSEGDPKLDLVVVIDDSLANSVATRWNELEHFLADLPAGARAGVAYANRASIQMAQQPTADHVLAAKALRDPAGVRIENASPYESIQALIRAWPSRQGRRVILLISPGLDRTFPGNGTIEDLPNVLNAVNEAQRKGVEVYSFYARSTAPLVGSGTPFVGAQFALESLSAATGGKAFYHADVETPPSLQPYLHEIQQNLLHQYILTFEADPGAKAGFAWLRVSTEIKAVQLRYPARVYVSTTK